MVQARAKEFPRLEKLLEDAGIKLSSVATGISGVSDRAMLQALIDEERQPAALADPRQAVAAQEDPRTDRGPD